MCGPHVTSKFKTVPLSNKMKDSVETLRTH